MTPRCRPGDLAVVVRSSILANLGRIVRVVRPYPGPLDMHMPSGTFIWLIEAAHPLTWSAQGRTQHEKQGPAPDDALQPIRGLREANLRRRCGPVDR